MSERTGESRSNRLAGESSPYLLLHAGNPVDWYPWGEEALARAREEEKPIFLSVGYSTCYWCHVMERESFSDPEVAAFMNERFVNVKVDREERPDLDEIYMIATQVLAGQGGWPNSVFLTPELEPFYAGTYFPPEERHGRPSFRMVLAGLADAWANRRDDVRLQGQEVSQAMRRVFEERFVPGDQPPPPGAALAAARALERSFDAEHAGFGRAPKFPTPANLFLLHELASDPRAPEAGVLLHRTLDAMARGGLYDQVGGGFHRYATDAAWLVPHFEKMLYDNGLLLELYALEHERTGDPEAARIARETAAFLDREMTSPEGAFWSAIDAETDGREGAYYVWTAEELAQVLGEEDRHFLAPLYGFDRDPFFEGTDYVLHLPRPLAEQAERRRSTREALLEEIAPLRERLFVARSERPRPATDDKVLADWNGMAIRGLAIAGRALGDPALVERAARAARYVLGTMRGPDGVLLHAVRRGEGRIAAFLADYAYMTRGLLALHEVTGEGEWLEHASGLAAEQARRLGAPAGGFFNAPEQDDLLVRGQEIFDGATPAANGVAVLALLDLHRATGDASHLEAAERALAAYGPIVAQAPEAVRTLAVAARRYHELRGTTSGSAAPAAADPGGGEGDLAGEAAAAVVPRLSVGEPDDGGVRPFRLELEIARGWHLNAHRASPPLVPTALEAEAAGGDGGEGLELLEVSYPEGERARPAAAGDEIEIYSGTVVVTGRLRGTAGPLVLSYQPCDESRCLPPVRRPLALPA